MPTKYFITYDNGITQCTFRLVSQFSLTLSLGHLFTEMCDSYYKKPSDKVNENCETSLSVMQLSLSYKAFKWHLLNIML